MRSVLCSAFNSTKRSYHNDSARCDALLNLPAWTLDSFIKSYSDSTFPTLLKESLRANMEVPPSLLDVHKHMMGLSTDYTLRNVMQKPDDSDLLWSGSSAPEWVACSQRNTTCYGKVSKSDWYSPQKAAVCNAVFSEQVKKGLVNSTSVGLDVCNLNTKTNKLCEVSEF
jgi:hypothetical protein